MGLTESATDPASADPSASREIRRQRLIAIGLTCCAVICFTGIDVCAKWISPRYGVIEGTWLRYASALAVVSVFLNPVRVPDLLATARPGLQALRGLCLLASTFLNFIALQYLQLAQTVSIMFLAPLLVALLAGPLLGEWAGPRRLAAIGVGFIGVLVITRPGAGIVHPAVLYSIAGTACYSVILLITRIMSAHDKPETTMFYSTATGVVALAPLAYLNWTTPAGAFDWLVIVLIGLFGALGHWILIQAQRRAQAPVLAPFLYTQVIWMNLAGVLLFGEHPDRWTLAGSAIVVASGLYLLHRERLRHVAAKPIV